MAIRITYPDGSKIQVSLTPDLKLIRWVALDTDGNVIGLTELTDGTVAVNEDLFDGPYRFGPGEGVLEAVQDLVDWWNSSAGALSKYCREFVPEEGGIGVICERQN